MPTNMPLLNVNEIKSSLHDAGYTHSIQIAQSMQGNIWRSLVPFTDSSVVIKTSNKVLHNLQMGIFNDKTYNIFENIQTEGIILRYLTNDPLSPNSLIKYLNHFESKNTYYLVMEDGSSSLFKFTQTIHQYIELGLISISDWHKMVKIIFKQMIECIQYIHSKNVSHFDISLENFLINKIGIQYNDNGSKLKLCADKNNIECKLCDFGLAEYFKNADFTSNKFCGKKQYKSPECVSETKAFNAKSNDIFSLGVVLFMLIIGSAPWIEASKNDDCFNYIKDGSLLMLLQKMNRQNYVNADLMDLFDKFFQNEDKRINIEEIKKCKWLNN